MPHSVDHLVLGAPDLALAVRHAEELLGARAAPGGRHPRWGTRNALLSLGPRTYLELMAPDPDRPDPRSDVLFGLDRLTGPRLIRWCAADDDLPVRRRAAAAAGFDPGEILAGRRTRPDGTVLTWRMTDPGVTAGDGLVPFLIDWGTTPHPATTAPGAGGLVELWATHPEPGTVVSALRALGVGLRVEVGATPSLVARIRTGRGDVELR